MSTPDAAAIWAEWNALPDDERSPVHAIAATLGIPTADVAAVVYPPGYGFGSWSDDDEPQDFDDDDDEVPVVEDDSGKAFLVRNDWTYEVIEWPAYERDHLAALYAAVGCHTIEHIQIDDTLSMWIDEEGKFVDRPEMNVFATMLGRMSNSVADDDVIVGHAVITGRHGPHATALSHGQLDLLRKLAERPDR